MTLEEIQKQIDDIRDMKGDSEMAHGAEDNLRDQFIRYVATLEIPTLAEKAKLVLSTNDMDFERWCA